MKKNPKSAWDTKVISNENEDVRDNNVITE